MADRIQIVRQILDQIVSKQSKKTMLSPEVQKELDGLLDLCKKNIKKANLRNIQKAFIMCYEGHSNKLRKSGEDYYRHPLAVATLIAKELSTDDITIIAALLHDIPIASDSFTIKDIQSEFGTTVAEIVDTVSKIHNFEEQNISHLENYRKLILSLFKDVRIIIVKIADRMHNLETLDYLEPRRQKAIALETLEIYAPFAHRFGLGRVKADLEDFAFKYLNKPAYDEINEAIHMSRDEREKVITAFIKPIEDAIRQDPIFKSNNIKVNIKGRPKHLYSIFNKMIIREKPMNELYDLFAIRIIIESDEEKYCFLAYSIISKIVKQVPDTYKDYITNPKTNGYKSIHVAFYDEGEKPIEVQIRTRKMHEVSEKGLASHFKYKRGLLPAQTVLESESLDNWFENVRSIFENTGNEISDEMLENARQALMIDEIYVFTPKDEFRVMPKNSTPLDFAYAIHSHLGNACIGAKVNGRIVPLNYKLNSGDRIEILTSKTQHPVPDWLKYVVTTKAKTVIQKYLKDDIKRKITEGKGIWEQYLKKSHVNFSGKEYLPPYESLGFLSADDFYLAMCNNEIDTLYFDYLNTQKNDKQIMTTSVESREKSLNQEDIFSSATYASCCLPVRGDKIRGVLGDGKSVAVHRNDCKELTELIKNKNINLIQLSWKSLNETDFLTKLRVTGEDKSGLLNEITSKLLNFSDIAIKSFHFDTKASRFFGYFSLSVISLNQINEIVKLLLEVEGVLNVERVV